MFFSSRLHPAKFEFIMTDNYLHCGGEKKTSLAVSVIIVRGSDKLHIVILNVSHFKCFLFCFFDLIFSFLFKMGGSELLLSGITSTVN